MPIKKVLFTPPPGNNTLVQQSNLQHFAGTMMGRVPAATGKTSLQLTMVEQMSKVEYFLYRHKAPDTEIPFEVKALASVEIESHIRHIRQGWEAIDLDQPIMDMALAPLEEFISHPERRMTLRRLKYLLELVKEYKRCA